MSKIITYCYHCHRKIRVKMLREKNFCGVNCRVKAYRAKTGKTPFFLRRNRKCKNCTVYFLPRSKNHRFCSSNCRVSHWQKNNVQKQLMIIDNSVDDDPDDVGLDW
jgi:hypothetical protein